MSGLPIGLGASSFCDECAAKGARIADLERDGAKLQGLNQQLAARVAELESALSVYADAKNWICPRCMNADNPDPINCGMLRWMGPGAPDGDGHGYEVARAALKEGK